MNKEATDFDFQEAHNMNPNPGNSRPNIAQDRRTFAGLV